MPYLLKKIFIYQRLKFKNDTSVSHSSLTESIFETISLSIFLSMEEIFCLI